MEVFASPLPFRLSAPIPMTSGCQSQCRMLLSPFRIRYLYLKSGNVSLLLDFIHLILQRWIRGILCDVWVAEKSSILGYQTTEIFFSRHDWNILVEEVNAHQELPIGMATYTAANVSGGKAKENRVAEEVL